MLRNSRVFDSPIQQTLFLSQTCYSVRTGVFYDSFFECGRDFKLNYFFDFCYLCRQVSHFSSEEVVEANTGTVYVSRVGALPALQRVVCSL